MIRTHAQRGVERRKAEIETDDVARSRSHTPATSLSIFLSSSLFEEEGAIQREGDESEVRESCLWMNRVSGGDL